MQSIVQLILLQVALCRRGLEVAACTPWEGVHACALARGRLQWRLRPEVAEGLV